MSIDLLGGAERHAIRARGFVPWNPQRGTVAAVLDQVRAVLAEYAAAYMPPPKPPDNRAFRGETCQAKAIAPDVLADIVREAILTRIDASTSMPMARRTESRGSGTPPDYAGPIEPLIFDVKGALITAFPPP